MLFIHNTHSQGQSMLTLFRSLPLPSYNNHTDKCDGSIVTRPQVAKILPLLRSSEDREAVLRMFTWWNSLGAHLQKVHTADGGACDFFEISLDENGVTIVVSIYRNDNDCIYLRIDPNCDLVIREVPL